MAKTRALAGYKVIGTTSDGVRILKPKMSPGNLRELRAIVARMRAIDSVEPTARPKSKMAGKSVRAKGSSRTK